MAAKIVTGLKRVLSKKLKCALFGPHFVPHFELLDPSCCRS